ncbi:DNA polymerase I [Legionella hackeliae]|uniref:DNA polymerase I n=1 Tax=Legionella hackeliae TaxID=449 RepID=A0A0A8UKR8_LEGHA|nr:DNA polymerase I [Legionella hackeliae]KTD13485.1 DNA polymerase I [Legionella hackeliae]CEK09328.1 DNA polymerase I [Legionella hackeliae]STX49233.1 DNA polymerase I [Legionella hackeliae]
MASPLILIDGSSYFFRAFHALPPLTTSKGQPTGAVYGVANMVKRLIKDYKPEQIAVIFDAKGKTFRDDWYPEYKAHRAPMPDDLSCQFQPLVTLLEAMGLPILIIDGVEADDVIGTITHWATVQGQPVLVSTSDKDMAQLVNEHVTLVNTMTNQVLNIEGVRNKFGVDPCQIIDYLTLIGDSVDNVPGVTKCGPKTAAKWLQEYQTLDNLLTNANKITGKIGEYLRESLAHLPLSKRLVTIKTDVALSLTLSDLSIKKANREQLIALTREMEFKNWLKELLGEEENEIVSSGEVSTLAVNFSIINTEEELNKLLSQLNSCQQFCFNIETNNKHSFDAAIVGIGLTLEEDKPVYLPLAHKDNSLQLASERVLAALKPFFENPNITKIGQNLKYDFNVLKKHDIHLEGMVFDIMLESYVLNSNASKHDRDSLALKYLGHKALSYEDVAGKGVKQLAYDALSVAQAAPYAAGAADVNLRLHNKLYPMLDEPLKRVLQDIEIPLLPVLAEMEYGGVLIDENTLEKHGERLKLRMIELEKEALALAKAPFNLNSPKQLQEILFDKLKLPVFSKTPTGQPSTAESVLQELAFEYRLPAVILEYRSLSKLVSTYIDALPKCISPITHRVHTCYNQAVAATGRLSSSDPNLQNIPIRNEEGRLIRKAFIAPPEHVLVAADYSQIELRIMAHLSQDENLLKAFTMGWDIHAATASEIFQVPLDEVSHEQRRRSKAINFGLIYGMSAFGLSKQLGIERQDAQNYMESYFKRYPGVLSYMERTRQQAHQQGYVETLFGRRLHLPEINTRNMVRQKAAERMAINAPMQGTAADIIKKAMLAISKWQTTQPTTYARMIMQVHDELIFEVHKDHIDATTHTIRELMEHAAKLSVPLQVSIGIGQDWDEAH